MSTVIENEVLKRVKKYPDKLLVLAYSGGVDSQVLLSVLVKLKQLKKITQSIKVCHIHHGLNQQADAWLTFAKQQSEAFGIDFCFQKVSLAAKPRTSIEEQAREARYQALINLTTANDIILTGHHLDDQAETFLLALKRGSGVKGLSSMQAETLLHDRQLVRPLLGISRAVIEEYAKQQQLSWVEDDSNQDNKYDRNFIRHQIMPVLKSRWAEITKSIARSASHNQEADQLLAELAQQDLIKVQLTNTQLSLTELQKLSTLRMKNCLRFFLAKNDCLLPSQAQLTQLLTQFDSATDKNPEVKVGSHWLRRYKNSLYLTEQFNDVSQWAKTITLQQEYDHEYIVNLPDSLGILAFKRVTKQSISEQLALNKRSSLQQNNLNTNINYLNAPKQFIAIDKKATLTITFNHNNPKCLPDYRQQSRPLKKVLQELNIPVWQRKRLPFVFLDDHLVMAAGHFTCQEYATITDEKICYQVTWLTN